MTNLRAGQVVALFIVGLGEYAVVWKGTDWEKEVAKGEERMRREAEAKMRMAGSADDERLRV